MPIYKCSKCGRTVEKPEGRYYCSKCGPSAVMVKLADEKRKRRWKTSLTNMELYHLIIPEVDLIKLNTQFPNKEDFRQELIRLAYESVIRNKLLNYPKTSWRYKKALQLVKEIEG